MDVTRFCDACHNMAFLVCASSKDADPPSYACRVCGTSTPAPRLVRDCFGSAASAPPAPSALQYVIDDPTIPTVSDRRCPYGCAAQDRAAYVQSRDGSRFYVCSVCRRHWVPA